MADRCWSGCGSPPVSGARYCERHFGALEACAVVMCPNRRSEFGPLCSRHDLIFGRYASNADGSTTEQLIAWLGADPEAHFECGALGCGVPVRGVTRFCERHVEYADICLVRRCWARRRVMGLLCASHDLVMERWSVSRLRAGETNSIGTWLLLGAPDAARCERPGCEKPPARNSRYCSDACIGPLCAVSTCGEVRASSEALSGVKLCLAHLEGYARDWLASGQALFPWIAELPPTRGAERPVVSQGEPGFIVLSSGAARIPGAPSLLGVHGAPLGVSPGALEEALTAASLPSASSDGSESSARHAHPGIEAGAPSAEPSLSTFSPSARGLWDRWVDTVTARSAAHRTESERNEGGPSSLQTTLLLMLLLDALLRCSLPYRAGELSRLAHHLSDQIRARLLRDRASFELRLLFDEGFETIRLVLTHGEEQLTLTAPSPYPVTEALRRAVRFESLKSYQRVCLAPEGP